MDVAVTVIVVFITVIVFAFIALYFWRLYDVERNDADVRSGRWMSDAVFRARWTAPFNGGFRGMRFPGVACAMAGARLDGMGRPLSCDECVVVISDDVTRTMMDLLTGKLDGEPFAYATATVAMWRRLGNAQELAHTLVVRYGADGVIVVEGRRRWHVHPAGLGVPEAVSTPMRHAPRGLPPVAPVPVDDAWEDACLIMR